MTKAVLTTKVTPVYDDLPEQRYHFPMTYLNQISKARGDWIVYYEPRRSTGNLSSSGGRQAYFATARIEDIVSDPRRADHYYAVIADYLPFDNAVPFVQNDIYYEKGLAKSDGSTNRGAFGRAVRNISDRDYDLILQSGFAHVLGRELRPRDMPDPPEEAPPSVFGFAEEGRQVFEHGVPETQDRQIISQLTSRPFRDRAFAVAVKSAYNDRCAMTGLKIINGGGRSEVQAAHIRPVADHGPDSVRNGLALCGTVHWMFDRGLLSVDDDFAILVAKGRVPDTIERILIGNRKLILPDRPDARPHRQFLEFHRKSFKG